MLQYRTRDEEGRQQLAGPDEGGHPKDQGEEGVDRFCRQNKADQDKLSPHQPRQWPRPTLESSLRTQSLGVNCK